jgi:hypothetical protein
VRRANPRWVLFGTLAAAVLWADIPTGAAQELPQGGGPVPPVRRGANGQIEVVPPDHATRPPAGKHSAARATTAPKPAPLPPIPHRAVPVARSAAPPGPPRPVITVAPVTPHVPDRTPRGATVATYSVMMSDGSPFTGTVRFGPPYYDGNGVFALSANKIIVNPGGPGLGPNKTTITNHITLEAIP